MIIKRVSSKEMIKVPSAYDMMIQKIIKETLEAVNQLNGQNIDLIVRVVVERALEELKNMQAIS